MHRIASRAVGAALLALAVSLPFALSSPARAGDGASPAPAAEPSLRQAALDAAIHELDHQLSVLRRTADDLRAGRPEAVTDDARRLRDLDVRGVREVSRYQAAHAKAVAALSEAAVAADAAETAKAQAAVESTDKRFVAAMKRIVDEREGKRPAAGSGDGKSGDGKRASADDPPRRRGHPAPAPMEDDED